MVASRVAPTEGRERIEGCGGRDDSWPTRTPFDDAQDAALIFETLSNLEISNEV